MTISAANRARRSPIESLARSGRVLRLALTCVILTTILTTSCSCEKAHGEPSPESVLLSKAAKALCGDVAPKTLVSCTTTATYLHSDYKFQLETYVKLPDSYREVRRAYGITEIHGAKGSTAWATVDGAVVPLDEAESRHLTLQPWLFDISRLEPLDDETRFGLEYRGIVKLEDGREVERLTVSPKDHANVVMTLDFAPTDSLLVRVELKNRESGEILVLGLGDYRTIQGIRVAHELTSLRNGKPYAKELVTAVTFNDTLSDDLFVAPESKPGDAAVIDKESVGGFVARTLHEGRREDIADTIEELKDWIAENKLEVAGPLIVSAAEATAETRPAAKRLWLSIPVSALPEGTVATLRNGFELRLMEKHRALCTTQVGDQSTPEILARLEQYAATHGLRAAGPAIEVHFSPDGRTRQVQLPVE